MRLKHYSLRTERCYCDWIRRYIHFHKMLSRTELTQDAKAKMELFLSDFAVNGKVAVAMQNQAFNALLFLYREVLDHAVEGGRITVREGKGDKDRITVLPGYRLNIEHPTLNVEH